MLRYPVPQRLLKPLSLDEITQARIVERFSFDLRQYVGSGRPWSYSELSARTGLDVRTVKAYAQGTACPSMARFKRMLSVLGPNVCRTLDATTGCEPRAGAVPPEALDLEALAGEIERAVDILSSFLEHSAAQPRMRPAVGRAADGWSGPAGGSPKALACDTRTEFLTALPTAAIDEAAIARRLGYRLGRMMAPRGPWLIEHVARRAGIDRRTLHHYVEGIAVPNLTRYIRLQRVMGPEIGVELALMLGWYPRHGRRPAVAFERLTELCTELSRSKKAIGALLDGRITPEPPLIIWRADTAAASERQRDA